MVLLPSANFLSKLTFSKKIFQEHYQRVNGLDPDHDRVSVRPDLGSNCLLNHSLYYHYIFKDQSFTSNYQLFKCMEFSHQIVYDQKLIIITPASNLGYRAPTKDNFHGCQIVHWDPLNKKLSCPKTNLVWSM